MHEKGNWYVCAVTQLTCDVDMHMTGDKWYKIIMLTVMCEMKIMCKRVRGNNYIAYSVNMDCELGGIK